MRFLLSCAQKNLTTSFARKKTLSHPICWKCQNQNLFTGSKDNLQASSNVMNHEPNGASNRLILAINSGQDIRN